MNLTKTQTKLLARLTEKGRISVGSYGGLGAYGGRVSAGHRETDAALALEKLGLLKRVSCTSHRIYNRGYCIHTTDITYVAP